MAIKGEGVARDEGPEPPAVTPYLIREAEEAGMVAVRRPEQDGYNWRNEARTGRGVGAKGRWSVPK